MKGLKQRSDGRYRCKYKDKVFYGATSTEALKARQKYIDDLKAGLRADSGTVTVREYSAKWLPVHKAGCGKDTYNAYANYVDQINDVIGDMPLSRVTPTDVKTVYNHFIGMSDSMIQKIKMLMVSIFRFAVLDGYIRTSPCEGVTPEKGYAGSHRAITDEERKWILETPSPMRLAVLVMLYAGLRRGEVLALTMDSVDLEENWIYVTEAVGFEGNKRIIKDPKTKAGTRAVPIFEVLKKELEGHTGAIFAKELSRSGFEKAWESYVHTVERNINGCQQGWYGKRKVDKAANPEKYASYMKLKKEAEKWEKLGKTDKAQSLFAQAEQVRLDGWIPFTVRPHDLRHSFVQMLCDAKVEIDLAMKWVGHGNEKMIRQIYDHVSDYRTEKATADVESVIKDRWK